MSEINVGRILAEAEAELVAAETEPEEDPSGFAAFSKMCSPSAEQAAAVARKWAAHDARWRTPFLDKEQPQRDAAASSQEGFAFVGYEHLRIDIKKPWLIKNVIARRETSSWIAPPGKGKSALLTEIAIHVASGRDWRGYRSKGTAAVIYFALERADLLKRRLEAYKQKHELHGLPIVVVTDAVDIMSPTCVGKIEATIRAVEKHYGLAVGLIIFDTFAKALAVGGGDEDKAKDQNRALGHLRLVQESTDVHVAFVGHTGKDESRGSRGSSAHPGDADLMVQISGDDVKSAITIKANDQPEGPLASFALEPFELGQDEDGDSISVSLLSDELHETPKSKSRKRGRPSNRDYVALKALRDALADAGEPTPASNHIPPGVKVVPKELWRKYAYQSGFPAADSDPEARKKAFQRAVEALQAKNLIRVWEPYVWTPDDD
jgi:AAA domain